MKRVGHLLILCVCLLVGVTGASAWHVSGNVYCDANNSGQIDNGDLGLANVVVLADGATDHDGSTDSGGGYHVELSDTSDCYTATLDPTTLPSDATYVIPNSGSYVFCTSDNDFEIERDWLIHSDQCTGLCWMTGGGVKFEPVTDTNNAEHGPKINFGGNVHPGCSAEAGQGGQWNHVDHVLKLHFQGTAIPTVQCGNIPGIPPGSESPVTPFNFIEYTGTGRLKGIKGNKVDFGDVYFFARAEDRNEPGSNGAKDGALIDRYFLRVYTNPADPIGSTVLLFDNDGDSATVDPRTITGGNIQLHISSCP
ncbi:MAG TPA: hypothetical protein VJV75_13690 [Candidatus Polarisedimenticolia bacterium]|nr:hypothetical protein [Candidatus Polarisedimenticolia bacterium]